MASSAIDCNVISRMNAERVRHRDDVLRSSFLSSFLDSLCRVRNKIMYVLSWRTVSVLTRVFFWCLFTSFVRNSGIKHQNDPLASAETVRHSSTYFILYILSDPSINALGVTLDDKLQWRTCFWDGPKSTKTNQCFKMCFQEHWRKLSYFSV